MIRFIFIAIFLVVFLIFSIPIFFVEWIVSKFDKRAADYSSLRIVQWALRVIIFISGTKIQFLGKENIPKDTAVLYVGNHRSYYDIVLTYAFCPGLTGYIAKKSMENIPLLSTWMKRLYCLFLDRDDIKAGLKTILVGIEQIKQGVSIFIFPEGTRNINAELIPFKEGSLKMAEKTGCPIIPVALTNTSAIFEDHFPRVKRTNVIIEYGKPIIIKELPKENQKFIGAYTQSVIEEMLKKHKDL